MTHNDPVTTLKNNDAKDIHGHSKEVPSTAKKAWDGELTDDEIQAEAALQLKYSGKPSVEEMPQSAEAKK